MSVSSDIKPMAERDFLVRGAFYLSISYGVLLTTLISNMHEYREDKIAMGAILMMVMGCFVGFVGSSLYYFLYYPIVYKSVDGEVFVRARILRSIANISVALGYVFSMIFVLWGMNRLLIHYNS